MNYHVHRQGENLGVFSLEELRSRREAGEFTGAEYLQGEGMSDWQPLDLVLEQGYRVAPPPLPSSISQGGPSQTAIWVMIGGGGILCAVLVFLAGKAQQGVLSVLNRTGSQRIFNEPRPQAAAAASKPVLWTTNTLTVADATKRGREFRVRQWLDGYEKRGQRNPECDAEIVQFLQTWLARNYGGAAATNKMVIEEESDKLAADTNCTDPLVLTIIADNSLNHFGAVHRFERALDGFPQSYHKSYPRFYATVRLAGSLEDQHSRVTALDASAV